MMTINALTLHREHTQLSIVVASDDLNCIIARCRFDVDIAMRFMYIHHLIYSIAQFVQ